MCVRFFFFPLQENSGTVFHNLIYFMYEFIFVCERYWHEIAIVKKFN